MNWVSEADCYKNIKVSQIGKIWWNDAHCRRRKKTLGENFSKFALLVKFTWFVAEVKFTLLSRKNGREYLSARKMRYVNFVDGFLHVMSSHMHKTF